MTEPSLEQRISECGKHMAIAAIPAYTVDGKIHPPTVVAACARMAGLFLLRSFHLAMSAAEPGEVILSPQASERSPVLLRTCAAVLASLGDVIPPDPPRPLVDDEHTPREEFLQTQARLESLFQPIVRTFGLDDYQAARAAAVATAITAHMVRKVLDPTRAFGVAAFAFMEGSRTVPAPPPGSTPNAG